jgi:hypothetical protein
VVLVEGDAVTPLLIVVSLGLLVVFTSPWWEAWMLRRDLKNRLLDRLEEEWEREIDDTDVPTTRNGLGW